MPALLKEHMDALRLAQSCSHTKDWGVPLPTIICDQFMTSVVADDAVALQALLDRYFPDRTGMFGGEPEGEGSDRSDRSGKYSVLELYPFVSHAARHGHVAVLPVFLEYTYELKSKDKSKDKNKDSPPQITVTPRFEGFIADEALDAGCKETILFLLGRGWDMNKVTAGSNRSPLLTSALSKTNMTGPDRDIVRWLVEQGGDLNARPASGINDTPMSSAVVYAPPDFLAELLDHHGGDVRRGELLHRVLRGRTQDNDTIEVLALLLKRGAPLNITMYASDAPSLRHYSLLDLGTPLHQAALMGNVDAVRYLLSAGADPTILSSRGKTALQWAEAAKRHDVAAVLRSLEQSTGQSTGQHRL